MDLKKKIKTALAARERLEMAPGPVPAAVLLPLYVKEGACHVLFTKRTEHLHHHRGEISFPGGVRHPEDRDALGTALRETWEEVGVAPEDVDVLGALDDFYSIHDYLVTPYVGLLPADPRFRSNAGEIERLIEVPLAHLLRPEIFRAEDWSWRGRTQPVYFFTYGNDEIWGLTAAILKQFLDIISNKA
ncbi:MAG TPA: CoA pyrophosphatase [Geobacteraceae bacterium]|nr:CoA pyrophosphatase [Geobacteraceae bacterium]